MTFDDVAEISQYFIARQMAIGIIVLFEIVYIQHNDAERFTLLPGCLDLAFKEFQKKLSMVEYIGQAVDPRLYSTCAWW